MSAVRGKYVLGQEVTASATAKKQTGTAVLSVRFSTEEIGAIEAASRRTGKSVSQLVRESVRTYIQSAGSAGYSVTVSGPHQTLATGDIWQSGKVAPASVELTLESVYGSVKPAHRPEDFKKLSRTAKEEKYAKTLQELRKR